MIDFVCATNNETVLKNNLKKSILFKQKHFILQKGYTNVPMGLENGLKNI